MRIKTIISVVKINFINLIKKFFFLEKYIIPYKILINLTDLCNSQCKFCDIWKIKPKNEINLKNIIKSLEGMENDLIWISFSGGEVTLVNYFYELIDYLKKNFKNLQIIAFTTNALAPEKAVKFSKYCQDKGFDTLVTISLDGDEETHDDIRGVTGNYKKCIYLKEELNKLNIISHFGITVSGNNSNLILNNYNKISKDIKAVTFVHSDGIYNKKNLYNEDAKIISALEKIYEEYKVRKLYELIEKIHIKISIIFLKQKRAKNIIPCDVLNSSVHIMPNGDLKPCMFMEKCGNIKDNKIKDILKNNITLKQKALIKKDYCPKCWMNCYSPHSIMQHPIKSFIKLLS